MGKNWIEVTWSVFVLSVFVLISLHQLKVKLSCLNHVEVKFSFGPSPFSLMWRWSQGWTRIPWEWRWSKREADKQVRMVRGQMRTSKKSKHWTSEPHVPKKHIKEIKTWIRLYPLIGKQNQTFYLEIIHLFPYYLRLSAHFQTCKAFKYKRI